MTHPGDLTPIDWAAAEKPCTAFIRQLEAEPGGLADETRLALFMAKKWLGGYPEMQQRCAEIGKIVERLPGNADALFEWSHCVDDDDARIALWKKTVELGHPGARNWLVSSFEYTGNYYGFPPETLARHAERYYEDANDVTDRYRAAQAIYRMALDTGDGDAAEAIQNRLIRDYGLDSLDYTPAHRDKSLERACAYQMFVLDLEGDLCVPALEASPTRQRRGERQSRPTCCCTWSMRSNASSTEPGQTDPSRWEL